MVKHVLMIKLKDNAQAECEKLRDLFLTMKGRVPQVIDVEAGADFLGSERSYDLALITVFEDRASFDAYQTHPVHMPVKKRMHEVRSASVACDYEF